MYECIITRRFSKFGKGIIKKWWKGWVESVIVFIRVVFV